MKRLVLLAPIAILAACGSSRGPDAAKASGEPMVYVASARPASDIARCLDSRLSRVSISRNNGVTDLTIGSSSNGSYFITLTPSNSGSVIKVTRGTGEDPPEEELRFAIARCTT
ncbi:sugar ABC transporter ATPase [Paraburkholderia sp. C35]|uniref:sugar ABC transporter ATPase n=1 Tax=Paraburkholderia sp. C35 TaxID=2126993 RepID=UPI000D695633|nr:sugar ABC transporter ATPase [Paraburkholderia sp. C35]